MLRTCVLALACLAILPGDAARAEPAKDTPPSVESVKPAIIAKADSAGSAPAAPSAQEAKTPDATTPAANAPAAETKQAATEPAPAKSVDAPKPVSLPEPTMKVSIDLATQRMTVSEHGSVVYTWPISSGTASHPTPRGTFRPQWTAKMWYSRKYDNAPMPNAVFINGGVAIHATYATGMLGRPASHGCIRLAPTNAKTFYSLVHKHGLKMTRVSVYGTPKWGSPAIASRRNGSEKRQVASQDSGWGWWDAPSAKPVYKPSYKATSAYDPGFVQKRKGRAQAPAYYYSQSTGQVYVRKTNGARVVYQPVQRRYKYNGYGYGYSSAW